MDQRNRTPFKKHALKKLKRENFTPVADKVEGVCVRDKGYHPGAHYTAEELEFIRAVEAFKRKNRTKFLAAIGFLRVALSLGYRRPATTSPPTPAPPMNAYELLRRLVTAGFRFTRLRDGSITFHPPPDVSSPERQHLLSVLAWSWGWLADHAESFLSDTPEVNR